MYLRTGALGMAPVNMVGRMSSDTRHVEDKVSVRKTVTAICLVGGRTEHLNN